MSGIEADRTGGPPSDTDEHGHRTTQMNAETSHAKEARPGSIRRPRVHQVLATLGYGDAIGHEVMGIQRVLLNAGYESEIFVESADPRLEDLTVDYREMVGNVTEDDVLIHHFSIGSRASRTAYALPGRMVLVYHNI